MAIDFFKQQDENELGKQDASDPQQTLGQESPLVTGSSQEQNSPGENAGEKKTASGSFTNLNSYLDANKSLKFGQQVAGKVGGLVDQANTAQGQADTGFRSAVDKSAVDEDKSLTTSVRDNPLLITDSEDAMNRFAKQRDARYAGPNSLVDTPELFTGAQTATDKAYKTAEDTKNEGGRKAYLDQEYGAGAGRYDYSSGQQKLDNLLIQNDEGSRDAFADVQNRAADTSDKFNTLRTGLDAYAKQKSDSTAAARANTRGALGIDDAGNITQDSPILSIQKTADERAKALNAQKAAEAAKYKSDLTSRKLTPEELQKFGLTAGQQLFGADTAKYLQTANDLDRNSAATKDEQARVAALSKLATLDNTYLPYADRAGAYDPQKFNTYNTNSLKADINSRNAAYNDAVNKKQYYVPDGSASTKTGGQQYSVQEALASELPMARYARDNPGYEDQSPIYRYQTALQALADLQKQYGFQDSIPGGASTSGDWRSLENFGGYTNSKGQVAPQITSDLSSYFDKKKATPSPMPPNTVVRF